MISLFYGNSTGIMKYKRAQTAVADCLFLGPVVLDSALLVLVTLVETLLQLPHSSLLPVCVCTALSS